MWDWFDKIYCGNCWLFPASLSALLASAAGQGEANLPLARWGLLCELLVSWLLVPVLCRGAVSRQGDTPPAACAEQWWWIGMRLNMPVRPHHGGPAAAPTPQHLWGPCQCPLCLQLSWHNHGDGATGPCRADPAHTGARQHRVGWSWSSRPMSNAPPRLQPPIACPALPRTGASLVSQRLFSFLPQPPSMPVATRAGRAAYLIGAVSLGTAAGGGGAVAWWFWAQGSAGDGAEGASRQAS